MSARLNPRRAKIHRNYTINEVAHLYCMHKNTVMRWIKIDGLPAMTSVRPHLVNGSDLRKFFEKKTAARKSHLQPGQMFCLSCKASKKPEGGLMEDISHGMGAANVQAICPDCNNLMHRRVARDKVCQFINNAEAGEDTSR